MRTPTCGYNTNVRSPAPGTTHPASTIGTTRPISRPPPTPSRYDQAVTPPASSQVVTSWPCTTSADASDAPKARSEEHTSELQSQSNLVCRLLLEKKKIKTT